ncbi:hypothetical protein [Amycolatopsis samaneae]|uniref:Uncharacterized protein n=1 Tax=Amycolatopsis samaneae TaxID=664691 RepID=A0ABW5GB36_9PSEU
MPLDDEATRALLRDLDDPEYLEHPRGYDHPAARARFDRLAAGLDERFRCSCAVDRNVQDASHHGTIVVPATATAGADHLTVTVSNFGDLAVVTLGNPGSHDEEEEQVLFHPDDRRQVEDELRAHGYVALSEHLLWNRYDGVSALASRYSPRYPPTWWIRFFDYL